MTASGDIKAGDRIVHKVFPPITRHTLALYCGASGDHNPIHVDIDFAKAAGFPDVFAHGMLAMAYLGQALTDVVPPSKLRSFATRFVSITQLGAKNGEHRARLALTTRDDRGEVKLEGSAVVAL